MTFDDLKSKNFFTLAPDSPLSEFLLSFEYPWQALPAIKEFVLALQQKLSPDDYYEYEPGVFLAKSVKLYSHVTLIAPTIICDNVEIRPGAFIRGNVYVGPGSVVGNSTEVKNSIFIDHVQAPHYNYVGDSILGSGTHLGAGVITSNLRADGANIFVRSEAGNIATHLRKFGAITAEKVEVGCNAVLNPGSMIGAKSQIYPLSSVRKHVPPHSIHKQDGQIVPFVYDQDRDVLK
ncbi:MAG: UDP-N-acetylglucosamine pyrophosphorylase [Eubacteriales bacterium]|nr:UDP-N-acetylglucosamine pyrophosphorylase [Eubacteriales bacterium]MDD4323991.1 UDP-N-acetylglucosamine pyrophosphorylase [Eubacteriales bacterium]MDD4541524.1 UDP-N-acetylglucosamine pyrophosphorylase [Eubacteriales bacterium]